MDDARFQVAAFRRFAKTMENPRSTRTYEHRRLSSVFLLYCMLQSAPVESFPASLAMQINKMSMTQWHSRQCAQMHLNKFKRKYY